VDYTLIIYLFVEVAHDALIATKVGYLNFWIARAIFFWVDGIYIDITQKIVGLKMKLMTIVLQKRTLIYQLVFWFSL
jgi:hypothetical protein